MPVKILGGDTLLAGVLDIAPKKLIESLSYTDNYKTHYLPKKSGGWRRIDEPPKIVKDVQKRILNIYFRSWYKNNWLDESITGFSIGKSIKTNALFHWDMDLKYTWRLDFKNAFPSLTYEVVRKTLEHYINKELDSYHNTQKYESYMTKSHSLLYSIRKNIWFRNLLNEILEDNATKEFVDYIAGGLIDSLTHLVTYKGKVPQGAPTSPFLLNLVVSHSGIMEKIRKYLQREGVVAKISIYADDITISSNKRVKFSVVKQIIEIIESTNIFKIHRKKILFFDITKKAPSITGIKLIKVIPENRTIREELLKRLPAFYREGIEMNSTGKSLKPFVSISLGKKNTKKIRAIIHLATQKPTDELKQKVDGYIAYLHDIYDGYLPKQISEPYDKYLKQK